MFTDTPSEGTVELFSEAVDFKASDSMLAMLRLVKIGFVFQTFVRASIVASHALFVYPTLICTNALAELAWNTVSV